MPFHLRTSRLEVRPWQGGDRAAFESLARDVRVQRYMAGRAMTDEETDAFFVRQEDHLASHGVCMGALVLRETGRVIGVMGMQPLGTTGVLEVGYWLEPGSWRMGFATEGASECLRHAFEERGEERVHAITLRENAGSRRVMDRLGMRFLRETTGRELGHRKPEIEVVLYEKVAPRADG